MSLKQMQALDTASEVKQEPVRIMGFDCVCGRRMEVSAEQGVVPAPQRTEQEPVAYKPPAKWTDAEIEDGYRGIRWVAADGVYGRPSEEDVARYLGYTTPSTAQRPWVGLTDEEMNEAMDYWSDRSRSAYGGAHAADGEYVSMISTWRYIEAKIKQKNGYAEENT